MSKNQFNFIDLAKTDNRLSEVFDKSIKYRYINISAQLYYEVDSLQLALYYSYKFPHDPVILVVPHSLCSVRTMFYYSDWVRSI